MVGELGQKQQNGQQVRPDGTGQRQDSPNRRVSLAVDSPWLHDVPKDTNAKTEEARRARAARTPLRVSECLISYFPSTFVTPVTGVLLSGRLIGF